MFYFFDISACENLHTNAVDTLAAAMMRGKVDGVTGRKYQKFQLIFPYMTMLGILVLHIYSFRTHSSPTMSQAYS